MACFPVVLVLLLSLQALDPVVTESMQLETGSSETGDVCKDCTSIFELLLDLLSSKELQKKIMDGVEGICEHLPGPKTAVKLCKEEVEKMLPFLIHFITGATKPAEICKLLDLCHSYDKQKMLSYFVNEALEVSVANEKDPQKNLCSFCLFLMRTLEGLLPKERTEDAVIHLLEEICYILPPSYMRPCEDIVSKFSKTVIDAILRYATPRTICDLLHLCKRQGETLLVDLCTVEAYRCKDFNTAARCGTLFYCQKFAWKSANNI